MNNFLRLLNHLEFSDPKSSLSDGNRKIVYLNAIELPDRNFDRIRKFTELNLTAKQFFEDFVFKSTQ